MSEEKIVKPVSTPVAPAPEPAVAVTEAAPLPKTQPIEPGKSVTLPDGTKTEPLGSKVDTLIPTDPYQIDPLFYEVANYFGLEQEDHSRAKNKLSEIVDYVIQEKQSNAPEAV